METVDSDNFGKTSLNDAISKILQKLPGDEGGTPWQVLAPNASFPGNHLSFAAGYTVTSTICGNPVAYEGEVRYHLCAKPGREESDLVIDDRVPVCGTQEVNLIVENMKSLAPRLAMMHLNNGDMGWDLRGLCYELGYVCGRQSFGYNYNLEQAAVYEIVNITKNVTSLGAGDFILSQALFSTKAECYTFIAIAKNAGVKTFYVLTDDVPETGYVLQGVSLGAYALRVFGIIMAHADAIGLGGPHVAAYVRGFNNAVTLSAHTSEGGWIRGLLSAANYPKVQGYVKNPSETEKMCIDMKVNLTPNSFRRVSMAIFLVGVRCVSAADPCAGKDGLVVPTILEATNGGANTHDKFDQLYYELGEFVVGFESALGRALGLTVSSHNSTTSYTRYFDGHNEDRHFRDEVITPWFWVEPLGLDVCGVTDKFGTPTNGVGKGTLSMFGEGAQFSKGYDYDETMGIPASNSTVGIKLKNTKARSWGVSYLLDARTNRHDGLALMEVTSEAYYGAAMVDWVNCNNVQRTIGGRRWLIVDSTVPNPSESIVGPLDTLVKVTYPGTKRLPNIDELVGTKVTITLGKMRMVDGRSSNALNVSNKCIPRQYRNVLGRMLRLRTGVTKEVTRDKYPAFVPINAQTLRTDLTIDAYGTPQVMSSTNTGGNEPPSDAISSMNLSFKSPTINLKVNEPKEAAAKTRFIGSGVSGSKSRGEDVRKVSSSNVPQSKSVKQEVKPVSEGWAGSVKGKIFSNADVRGLGSLTAKQDVSSRTNEIIGDAARKLLSEGVVDEPKEAISLATGMLISATGVIPASVQGKFQEAAEANQRFKDRDEGHGPDEVVLGLVRMTVAGRVFNDISNAASSIFARTMSREEGSDSSSEQTSNATIITTNDAGFVTIRKPDGTFEVSTPGEDVPYPELHFSTASTERAEHFD